MAEYSFTDTEDFRSFASDLQMAHQARITRALSLQNMWEGAVRTTPDGSRTLYINNEPATATKLTVTLADKGALTFKAALPPTKPGQDREDELMSAAEVERLLLAHYRQTDYRLFRSRRGTHTRQSAWNYAVYGWNCGINLVRDAVPEGEWPIHSDIWSPLDTYADMDGGHGILHIQRMSLDKILKTFGPDRASGKSCPGYNFDPGDAAKRRDLYTVQEWFDDETSCVYVDFDGGKIAVLKAQEEHHLGCNPAWMAALDSPPFRASASNAKGQRIQTPDFESNRWLEFYGQSPMLLYEGVYRVLTEAIVQVQEVMQRYANQKILIRTASGRTTQIDFQSPIPDYLEQDTIVEVVKMDKFPLDERAFIDFLRSDIEKGSYPRAAYGTVTGDPTTSALQLLQQASGYIIEPIVRALNFEYTIGAESILTQLTHKIPKVEGKGKSKSVSYSQRSKQYDAPKSVRTLDKRKRIAVADFTLSKLPEHLVVTAELKGAGVPTDKLQTLMAVNNILQSPRPVVSHEELLENYVEHDDPAGEMSRVLEESMTNAPGVLEKLGPIWTLMRLAARFKKYGTPEGDEQAKFCEALAQGTIRELAATVQQDAQKAAGVGPVPPGAGPAMPGAPGPGPLPAGGQPAPMMQGAMPMPPDQAGPAPEMMPGGPMPPMPGAAPEPSPEEILAFVQSLPPQIQAAILQESQGDPQVALQIVLKLMQESGGGPGGPIPLPGPEVPPAGQITPGIAPQEQVAGISPVGAPVAGMSQPATGPQPLRGMQMRQAQINRPQY